MKKLFSIAILCSAVLAANAIPAYRGWQTRTQADGTTIEVKQMGDEYYHYLVTRDGKQVREVNGMFKEIGEAPTTEVAKARRAQGQARKMRQDVGTDPYPAPRGLLILANFSNVSFKEENSAEVMIDMITSDSCTTNNSFGSAAQYFRDQSNGKYAPQFDVYGPVTLSKTQKYYGENDSDDNDKYATDAVIEACILANEQYDDLNFADYDWNDDGYVDFVYVIYAGKGEADGGAAYTIWPHNYSVQTMIAWGGSTYTKAQTKLDGKYLDNYAMSQELKGWNGTRSGIGVFCHEFGHVIGLPDFYDTNYGKNYNDQLTPNDWDIMDGGGYNGNGHCPPNYSVWEKYFMGWTDPVNLGNEPALLTLYPNGTRDYNSYQINASGVKQAATKDGLNYYIECRQRTGWDTDLPAAGMLIWKVNFSASAWRSNTPNNTANNPRYTLVIPSGTKIGGSNGLKNVWPYSTKNSWDGVSDKPLKDIKKVEDNITLTYIDVPSDPVYKVKWVVDGEVIETVEYSIEGTDDLALPTAEVTACEGTQFIGWTREEEWCSPFAEPEDLFTVAEGKVTKDVTYYALFR